MAETPNFLDELIAKLAENSGYTALPEEERKKQAQNRYQSAYDQNRLTAQQQHDINALALSQQLNDLQAMYDTQREQSAKNYQQTAAAADRQSLSRGMQRSSYNNATLANIGIKGNEAQQAISKNQEGSEKNIGEQKTLLTNQLAAQLAQYDKSQLADQLSYQDELESRDYDRTKSSQDTQNQLATQIYEYQLEALDKNRWGMAGAVSSGGSQELRGTSSTSGGKKSSSASSTGSSDYGSFASSLGGSKGSSYIPTVDQMRDTSSIGGLKRASGNLKK